MFERFFKRLRYRFWLYRWAKNKSFKEHPHIRVKRSYTTNKACIDLYWTIKDSHGHSESYYDRISWHGVPNVVRHIDHKMREQYLKDRKEAKA